MNSSEEIQLMLHDLENMKGVKVLLAAECSSRSWGYASKNSDHDVFFIYRSNPKLYLNLFDKEYTILHTGKLSDGTEITLTGWDASKALQLASKSNPMVMELIAVSRMYRSNTYIDDLQTSTFIYEYIQRHYNPHTLAMSYMSTARHHLQHDYLRFPDNPTKKAKHLIAGFRSQLLAEYFWRNENPFDEFEQLYSPATLFSSLSHRHGCKVLTNLIKSIESDPKDLDDLKRALDADDAMLMEKIRSSQVPSQSKERFDELNDFFFDHICK